MVIIKKNDMGKVKNLVLLNNLQLAGGLIKVKLKAPEKRYFPFYTGAIVRASFLSFVNEQDQALADWFHRSKDIRPFSTTQLQIEGRNQHRTKRKELISKEGDILSFKIGILDNNILERIIRLFLSGTTPYFKIFDKNYEVMSMEYTKIKNNLKIISDKAKIHFLSPTYFTVKSKPEPMLFPDPKYFFMNLVKIWNTMNPKIVIPEEPIYEWIDKNVVINDYATYTRRIYISKSRPIIGFMGWVVYRFKEKKAYFPWINALLEYAKISNVGGNRTGGMGEVDFRWLEEKKARISKEKMI